MRIKFILSMALLLTLVTGPAAAEPIAVIVNLANSNSSMSKSKINEVYRGLRANWSDGEKVVGVNYAADNALRVAFYRQVLDSAADAEFYRPGSPTPFKTSIRKSSRSVLRFVSRFDGAIGYLPRSELDDSVKLVYTFE